MSRPRSTRQCSWSFSAFEFAGEKVIHHQCRDESRDAKIQLWIVIQHVQAKLITSTSEPREQLVYRKFLFVCPLGNRGEQPPPSPSQICACLDSRRRAEKLSQIGVIKIRIRIFVEFAFPRVISLQLDVETIVIPDAILRGMHRRLARKRLHELIYVFQLSQCWPTCVLLAPIKPRGKPNRERLGKIFIWVTLRVPVFQVHYIAAAKWAWPVSIRRLLTRRWP